MKNNREGGDKALLQIPIRNMFRLAEQWKYDHYDLDGYGEEGVSKEEAQEVYIIFDRVFKETFPAQAGLGRLQMTEYLQKIVRAVHSELIEGKVDLPGAFQDLVRFIEQVQQRIDESNL